MFKFIRKIFKTDIPELIQQAEDIEFCVNSWYSRNRRFNTFCLYCIDDEWFCKFSVDVGDKMKVVLGGGDFPMEAFNNAIVKAMEIGAEMYSIPSLEVSN